MKLHANAPLGPKGRRRMVLRVLDEGLTLTEAAEGAGVSVRTAGKWVRRYRAEGEAGLLDRSSAPRHVHNVTPPERVEAIAALRRLRLTGPEIAETLEMATSTVSAVLGRIGLGRLSRLEPEEPIRRYERSRPGELIHVDVKKLGRISVKGADHRVTGDRRGQVKVSVDGAHRRATGWEFVHVCVDDATRLAYVEVLGDEKGVTAAGFLRRAVAWLASMGVTAERVLSDNGSCYRSTVHARACAELGMRHLFTRPYRPRTNGKAERFIQTALREWAYAQAYPNSHRRATELPFWLHRYNWHRPHGSLKFKPPISRLVLSEDNLLRLHT